MKQLKKRPLSKKIIVWRVIAISLIVFIYITTLTPAATGSSTSSLLQSIFNLSDEAAQVVNVIFRKAVHLITYGVLAVIIYQASRIQPYLKGFIGSVLVASGDEWLQVYIPSRSGLVSDVLIDAVGACIGLFFVWYVTMIKTRKRAL